MEQDRAANTCLKGHCLRSYADLQIPDELLALTPVEFMFALGRSGFSKYQR